MPFESMPNALQGALFDAGTLPHADRRARRFRMLPLRGDHRRGASCAPIRRRSAVAGLERQHPKAGAVSAHAAPSGRQDMA